MFIHFAFGTLGKQRGTYEQTKAVVDHILTGKRLKASKCKEFIPIFPDPNSKPIPLKPFKSVEGRTDLVVTQIDVSRLGDRDTIGYLPEDVTMICFIKIDFDQLKNSMHSHEYGKFGIVLTDDFLKCKGLQPVYYYTEESLYRDPLILKWNNDWENGRLSDTEAKQLQREITAYRKPAKLFPSFSRSVTHMVQFGFGKPQTDYFTYNRYPQGYDFKKENEYRIVPEDNEDLYFDEDDLYMIIVPTIEAKITVESFLDQNWREKPKIEVYPA